LGLCQTADPIRERGGRKREIAGRDVLNGILYVLSTACKWRALPKDLPPRSTVHGYLQRWDHDGTLMNVHDALYVACREQAGREASPTHVSSLVRVRRAPKKGASIDPSGYDAGKKIKGKKRHVLVDMPGLMLHAIVHAAGTQDRDGDGLVLNTLFGRFPFLTKLFADGGYQGPVFAGTAAQVMPGLSVEIVKRSDVAKGFDVLPKR
jgi:transposase